LPTGTTLRARLEVDGVSSLVQAYIPPIGSPSFIGPWVTI
jgi:hypothetical protein